MQLVPMDYSDERKFQSAPDREVGRCGDCVGVAVNFGRFNPRPTVRSGDATG